MAVVGIAEIEVRALTEKFERELKSDVAKAASKADAKVNVKVNETGLKDVTTKASSATSALQKMGVSGSIAGGILGGALAGGAVQAGRAVLAFVGEGVSALARIEKIAAQTNAAIASTGGAANVTQKGIASLGQEIERLTGIESESVQEAENLLLTFTNIKNGVGQGNQVFDDATRILTDMSVALGTDVSSSAIQLGKALNDPIQGITALTRVGVTFTDEQKKQIKALVESGNIMKAQKVIIAELTKEFGGSAEALGDTFEGKLNKLKNTVGDLQEGVAAGVVPALSTLVDAANAASGGTDGLAKAMELATRAALGFVTVGLSEAIPAVVRYVKSLGDHDRPAKQFVQGQQGMEGATISATQSIEDQEKALDGLLRATIAQFDSALGYERALDGLTDTQAEITKLQNEYNEAVKAHGPASQEARDAAERLDDTNRDLKGSYLDVAAAAVKQAQDQAAARGETLSSQATTDIYRQKLVDLAATTSGPLRAALDGYIATLGSVPKDVETALKVRDDTKRNLSDVTGALRDYDDSTYTADLDVNTSKAQKKLDALRRGLDLTIPINAGAAMHGGQIVKGYMAGGQFPMGQPILVGEAGPELLIPTTTGSIVSNADLMDALRALLGGKATTTSGASGPITVIIQESASPEATVRVLNRELAKGLR